MNTSSLLPAEAKPPIDHPWRPTVAYFRAASVSAALVAAALLFRRPDLLVIAAPLSVVTLWS